MSPQLELLIWLAAIKEYELRGERDAGLQSVRRSLGRAIDDAKRESLGMSSGLIDDTVKKVVAEKTALMEGFVRGFCVASGLGPENLELVEQMQQDKIVFHIRRKG